MPILHLGQGKHSAALPAECPGARRQLYRRGPGCPGGKQESGVCPCSKAAHHWQECSWDSEGRWLREVTFLLYSEMVRPYQQYCVWFGSPQCETDMDVLEQAQQTPLSLLVAVGHDMRGEAERAGYGQDGEEKAEEDLTAVCSCLMSQMHGDLFSQPRSTHHRGAQ